MYIYRKSIKNFKPKIYVVIMLSLLKENGLSTDFFFSYEGRIWESGAASRIWKGKPRMSWG